MKNNKKKIEKYQKKYTVTKQHVTKTPFEQWHMVVQEQHINAGTITGKLYKDTWPMVSKWTRDQKF